MATVFVLGGLGAQHFGMARSLFESDSYFKYQLEKYDNAFNSELNLSIVKFLYNTSKKDYEIFDDLLKSTIATFVIEISAINWLTNKGIYPDYYLSTSFGTLVAGIASGSVSDREYVSYIIRFAKVFQYGCNPGGMTAILCCHESLFRDMVSSELAEVSGVNFDSHFTISYPSENHEKISCFLKKNNIAHSKIAISRAFHSKWIDNAQDDFISQFENIGNFLYNPPIVSTAHKSVLDSFNAQNLWEAFRRPIYFKETLHWLESKGPHQYFDVGPSTSMSTLLKYALPINSSSQVSSVYGQLHGC